MNVIGHYFEALLPLTAGCKHAVRLGSVLATRTFGHARMPRKSLRAIGAYVAVQQKHLRALLHLLAVVVTSRGLLFLALADTTSCHSFHHKNIILYVIPRAGVIPDWGAQAGRWRCLPGKRKCTQPSGQANDSSLRCGTSVDSGQDLRTHA